MSLAKVTRNFQVTIPAEIRKKLHIRMGALLDFAVREGVVIVKPKAVVDENQAWFWTKKWQEGEKKVDEAIEKGETISFDDVDQMRKHFEE